MKKFVCFALAFLLCIALLGCNEEAPITPDTPNEDVPADPPAKPEPDPDSEFEVIELENPTYISGEIKEILSPTAFVLNCTNGNDSFGETVEVVTEEPTNWCAGDPVTVYFTKANRPRDPSIRVSVHATQIYSDQVFPEKPIIYFYPEEPTEISVEATLNGKFTCTYPDYGTDGWQNFTAYPDGRLIFPDGKEYYALYWEGILNAEWDFSQGWCVRGEDTAAFLEWALAAQGLTAREANEFIIYWLPRMQNNPYNVISFQSTAYTYSAVLEIAPSPDSLLRVFMTYYATDAKVDIPPQSFESFVRQGFTVVEWGGSEIQKP